MRSILLGAAAAVFMTSWAHAATYDIPAFTLDCTSDNCEGNSVTFTGTVDVTDGVPEIGASNLGDFLGAEITATFDQSLFGLNSLTLSIDGNDIPTAVVLNEGAVLTFSGGSAGIDLSNADNGEGVRVISEDPKADIFFSKGSVNAEFTAAIPPATGDGPPNSVTFRGTLTEDAIVDTPPDTPTTGVIPVPPALGLFVTALGGLALVARRRNRA